VARKKKDAEDGQPFELTRIKVLLGILVVAVFAGLAIAVVSLIGGSSLSEAPAAPPEPPGAIGDAPAIERSAAADVLANKTWDTMTQNERDLVKSEVTRVFDNATFRAVSSIVRVDVYRRDSHTRVTRQFQRVPTPGGKDTLQEQLNVYCPASTGVAGALDAYKYTKSPLGGQFAQATSKVGLQPWDPILARLDWSDVKDLGVKDVGGRRAHGIQMKFVGANSTVQTQHWFDVENGRLLERIELDPDGTPNGIAHYTLDYRKFAPIAAPQDQPQAPCYDELVKAFNS
jgi:hypothetical protein